MTREITIGATYKFAGDTHNHLEGEYVVMKLGFGVVELKSAKTKELRIIPLEIFNNHFTPVYFEGEVEGKKQIVLTKSQSSALENLRGSDKTTLELITLHSTLNDLELKKMFGPLSEVNTETLVEALTIGYTIEQTRDDRFLVMREKEVERLREYEKAGDEKWIEAQQRVVLTMTLTASLFGFDVSKIIDSD